LQVRHESELWRRHGKGGRSRRGEVHVCVFFWECTGLRVCTMEERSSEESPPPERDATGEARRRMVSLAVGLEWWSGVHRARGLGGACAWLYALCSGP
jgi:hypothetical protein